MSTHAYPVRVGAAPVHAGLILGGIGGMGLYIFPSRLRAVREA